VVSFFIGYPEDRLQVQLTGGMVIHIYLDVGRKKRILAALKGKLPTAFSAAR